MSTDDLRQEGMIALLAAARTYDPSRGASFRTYARTCVENAICSALRAVDPLPQEVRADGRRLREAEMSFAPGTNEPVTRSELATVLGMSLDRVHLVLNALAFSDTMITLDSDEMVWDRTQPSPEDTVVTRDDADRVAEALDSLPRRDRAIVIMRIMEAVPNHTVAQIHGVSPGRVSQVVKESLDHLRTILTEPYLGV